MILNTINHLSYNLGENMAKTVYLVRHGQTYFNFYHKVQGRCDSPLTELGIRQVEKSRDYFVDHKIKFDHAYSSTQERASDTLEIITDHEMKYSRLKDLREKCYGIFEGQDEFLLPWNYGNDQINPTMELNEDVVARMKRAMIRVLNETNDGETSLVVGHGDILARYVRKMANQDDFSGFDNAAIVKLTFDGEEPTFDEYIWPAKGLSNR